MGDASVFEPAALLLIAAVAAVGVLHTAVPDHWVPITLMARQRGWSRAETAWAALRAGAGHVLSTLLIALVVWFVGVAAAERFGRVVDLAASVALLAFGSWVAVAAWRELSRTRRHHGHARQHLDAALHGHHHPHAPGSAMPDKDLHRSKLPGIDDHHHDYWAHFVGAEHHGHAHDHNRVYPEADEGTPDEDGLYAPLAVATAVRHRHVHRHSRHAPSHAHWHDHIAEDAHPIGRGTAGAEAPLHQHRHRMTGRTALLLILGSSPMVEGIPAFFAAVRFGVWLAIAMAIVFAFTTVATYVLLCVFSTAGLQRVRLGSLERYGEVLSGAFIAAVGLAACVWPAL